MGASLFTKRFRINPVETALIAGFGLLFCHSAFRLFSGAGDIRVALATNNHLDKTAARALASAGPTTATPIALISEPGRNEPNRALASVTQVTPPADLVGPSMPTSELAIDCDHEAPAITVPSIRMRITGVYCHAPEHFDAENPDFHAEAVLTSGDHIPVKSMTDANHFIAEVPLESGANTLRIEFAYPDGSQFSRNFQITRQ